MALIGAWLHSRQEVLVLELHLEQAVLLQIYWIKMNSLIPKLFLFEVNPILATSWVESGKVVSTFLALHPVG